jgi:hypothetical protein
VLASFAPTRFPSDLSCHYYHLILLLRIGKLSDPLKGDAHEENTSRSYKLSDRDLHMSCLRTKENVKSRHEYLTEEKTEVIDIFRGAGGFAMGFARGAR